MLCPFCKRAVRIVAAENLNAHTQPIFKRLKILPFNKLILYFNLQLMQTFKQGLLPISFSQAWSDNRIRRGDQLEISLRNENLLNIPFARLSSSIKLPLDNLPQTWENFQNESIKIISNKLEFYYKLKEHFLGELSEVMLCTVIVYFALFVSFVPKNNICYRKIITIYVKFVSFSLYYSGFTSPSIFKLGQIY